MKTMPIETMESHKLLANIFSPIGLNFDKNFENGHHVWGTVIYRKFNTNMTFLVEIKS